LTATERGHYGNAFKKYQFCRQEYKDEQKVASNLKQYIRNTVTFGKQLALDETGSISDWIRTLYTSICPTPEQLIHNATTKYRESLIYPTKNVSAWFDKWEEAMAMAEKYQLFGGHKVMWIKDIYTIWREKFPMLSNDYTRSITRATPQT
jgi:hypothetical protein